MLLAGICLGLAVSTVRAQTTVNPDISVIPRFLLESNDGERLGEGIRRFSRPELSFQELEVAISSYLNPFARADVFLTLPGPDLETAKLGVEEVYVTVVRGLPLDLNVRLGKYRVEFGKLNTQHPHAWPFITQPLVHERFLGEEGLNDLGISASALLPTGDLYTRLTMDLLRGNGVAEATGIGDTSGARPFYAVSGRLMTFVPVGDAGDLELGISGYTGIHDPYARDRFWYFNADAKYKYKPDSYTSLELQGEFLLNTRTAERDRALAPFTGPGGMPVRTSITSSGLYVFADYQFMKVYSIGARYDWTQSPYSTDDRAHAVALFAGFYPVEETLGLRLEARHMSTTTPEAPTPVNSIALQVLFSLGPHKAHPF
jgi:hypothetical protein